MSNFEKRHAHVALTIHVDKYYPHCCSMACSYLTDIAEHAMPLDESRCRMFNQVIPHKSVAGDVCDARPNRCQQCLERFPEPHWLTLLEPPEFIPGETYRCRYPNSEHINVYIYNGIDAWKHHVFEGSHGNTAMGDVSHLTWLVPID